MTIDAEYVTQQLVYAHRHDAASLPAGYFDFMAAAPAQALNQLYKRSLLENSLLANIAFGYGSRLLPGGRFSADPAEGPRLYALATRELGEGRARDWALEQLIFRNMRGNLPGAQAFYRTFRLHNADSALARTLRQDFADVMRMQPGQLAPSFTLTDLGGQQVSLRDFRGKVVYLDFWGSWCAPCLREMTEFAPALKKRFTGQDVVFLYVAVGDAEAKWQQTVAEQHFASANSVHLRAPDRGLADTYQVNRYPSYYLIGRDGRLVQPYAPQPSDGDKTVAAIEAALQQ